MKQLRDKRPNKQNSNSLYLLWAQIYNTMIWNVRVTNEKKSTCDLSSFISIFTIGDLKWRYNWLNESLHLVSIIKFYLLASQCPMLIKLLDIFFFSQRCIIDSSEKNIKMKNTEINPVNTLTRSMIASFVCQSDPFNTYLCLCIEHKY